ncbi:hypothetical protein [Pyrococcus yayanosii]|uniref:Uncharacterized protein n=1 Tax=Pyrococcus yayanosii (strain CH1 / JCM 16557) TaxID=529709 RepID=F8AGK8_PYRYC|nr:hypothetical protein [Pyrococcus yayanosii]AEH23979.1 hypothetical protein PYCH_02820 [Pyrococcus yayanosii CH1]
MRFTRTLVAILFLGAFLFGSYPLRWICVLLTGIMLFVMLLGSYEGKAVRVPAGRVRRRDDFKRLTDIVRRARPSKGTVARKLIEDRIAEIYANLGRSHEDIRENPPEALRVLRSYDDFLAGLEKALELVGADLNEG